MIYAVNCVFINGVNKNMVKKMIYVQKCKKGTEAYAKFRCDIASIRIETGRLERLSSDNRYCFNDFCMQNQFIEDENMFWLDVLYTHI